MKSKAVFFDRDGVLNEDVAYLYKISDLRWVEDAREAVAYLTQLGYKIFIVTNQSGIARGYYTVEAMQKLHEHMQRELAISGGKIEKIYYCPHHPEGSVAEYTCVCDCRKPKPGMLLQAFSEYDIDKEQSFLIGDGKRDVEAAEAAGIKGYLFQGGSLLEFVQGIMEQQGLAVAKNSTEKLVSPAPQAALARPTISCENRVLASRGGGIAVGDDGGVSR